MPLRTWRVRCVCCTAGWSCPPACMPDNPLQDCRCPCCKALSQQSCNSHLASHQWQQAQQQTGWQSPCSWSLSLTGGAADLIDGGTKGFDMHEGMWRNSGWQVLPSFPFHPPPVPMHCACVIHHHTCLDRGAPHIAEQWRLVIKQWLAGKSHALGHVLQAC